MNAAMVRRTMTSAPTMTRSSARVRCGDDWSPPGEGSTSGGGWPVMSEGIVARDWRVVKEVWVPVFALYGGSEAFGDPLRWIAIDGGVPALPIRGE